MDVDDPGSRATTSAERLRRWLVPALLVAVSLGITAPTWNFGLTYLDDDDLIANQRAFLETPSSLVAVFGRSYFGETSQSYYRPVVNASFVIDALGTGVQFWRLHLTNSLLHAVACVLAFVLGRRLGLGDLCAAWAALVFAVHPAACATVAWIVGRSDLLFACFALGACVPLLDAPSRTSRGVHFACFALALLSKETALVLPAVFAGLVLLRSDGRADRAIRRLGLGWGAVLVAAVAVRVVVVGSLDGSVGQLFELAPHRAPVFVADWDKIVVPVRPQALAAPDDVLPWPGLVALGVLASAFFAVPAIRRRVVAFLGASAAAVLVAGVAATRLVVLENRLYFAIAMVALCAGEVLRACRERWPRWSVPIALAALALAPPLAAAAVMHSAAFRDRFAFAEAAIRASPGSGVAVNLLQRNARARAGVPDPR